MDISHIQGGLRQYRAVFTSIYPLKFLWTPSHDNVSLPIGYTMECNSRLLALMWHALAIYLQLRQRNTFSEIWNFSRESGLEAMATCLQCWLVIVLWQRYIMNWIVWASRRKVNGRDRQMGKVGRQIGLTLLTQVSVTLSGLSVSQTLMLEQVYMLNPFSIPGAVAILFWILSTW